MQSKTPCVLQNLWANDESNEQNASAYCACIGALNPIICVQILLALLMNSSKNRGSHPVPHPPSALERTKTKQISKFWHISHGPEAEQVLSQPRPSQRRTTVLMLGALPSLALFLHSRAKVACQL